MKNRVLTLLGMILAMGGCSLAPNYVRPAAPIPSAWPAEAAPQGGAPSAAGAVELPWREFFTEPRLRSVIELALANNRDLRVSALNVEKAQALYRIQRSDLFPTVNAVLGGEKYRLPEKMSPTGEAQTVSQYSVNLGVTAWELDFFGRIHSLKTSALNQYLATEQARRAAQISLVAAVAQQYLALAADTENLKLSQATMAAQKSSYDLILIRRDSGMGTDLELSQAGSQVEAARADLARYRGLVAADKHALDLLAGTTVPPDMTPDGLGAVTQMIDLPGGVPSGVLLSRPDILMSEFQLQAANANIGAARAAFFPRIALTTGAGFLSNELSVLFDSGSRTWNFAPQVSLPIFDAGRRKARLKGAVVDRDISIAQYEKAIQSAFREVSDALTLRRTLVDQLDAQQSLVNSLGDSFRLSEERYRAGIDGYLGVLVAQRALYAGQQGLVQVRLARQVNLVNLYKVLGGGL